MRVHRHRAQACRHTPTHAYAHLHVPALNEGTWLYEHIHTYTHIYTHTHTQDLLRLIDIIIAFTDKLDEVLVGKVGLRITEMLPSSSILKDNVIHMTEMYVDKLGNTLGTWMENIVRCVYVRMCRCVCVCA